MPLIVALLAAVLALQAADLATVGAVGAELESAFGLNHFELALLAAVASLIGAAATLPFGVLADRLPRVRLLAFVVSVWGVATVLSGFAVSFATLLGSRLFLGVAVAAAGPLLASLVGDLFPAAERARIYGYILTGELAGSGFGFLVAGNVAGFLSWRWAFWVLAVPAWVLAWLLRRHLREPERGAQVDGGGAPGDRLAYKVVREARVEPDPDLVLHRDAERMSLREATRYVLRIRTNVVLIVVSATSYFFLGGLQTFGVIYVRRDYGLGQSAATSILALLGIGAVLGVLLGGRLADRLLSRGRLDARILVAAVVISAAAALALPPFLGNWPLLIAMPLFVIATAFLSAGNPPLDAARLDVVPAGLWGRAESIRTVLRSLAIASAPLLFGLLANLLGDEAGEGLRVTFMLALIPLGLSGLVLLWARRSYPTDVATALAAER